jgi:hypothetical protein
MGWTLLDPRGAKENLDGQIGILYIILIILQNYATISKIISFDNQLPWPTAVADGGLQPS